MWWWQLQVAGGSAVAVPMPSATTPPCVCSGADVTRSHPRRSAPIPGRAPSTRPWRRCLQSSWKRRAPGRWKGVSSDAWSPFLSRSDCLNPSFAQDIGQQWRLPSSGLWPHAEQYNVTNIPSESYASTFHPEDGSSVFLCNATLCKATGQHLPENNNRNSFHHQNLRSRIG